MNETNKYRISHIGIKKTEAMKSIIREINPFVEVDILDIKVDRENIYSIVGDSEIVVEAFDRAETKAMILEELLTDKNKIVVSASGMAGLGSANEIVTRKIKDNFYLIGDNYSDYEEYSGIMSTRVMLCASANLSSLFSKRLYSIASFLLSITIVEPSSKFPRRSPF